MSLGVPISSLHQYIILTLTSHITYGEIEMSCTKYTKNIQKKIHYYV
jgi:hypothetical protein